MSEITLKQLEKLLDEKLKHFATKKDLEGFATKKDLEKFASKEDLKGMQKAIQKDIASSQEELAGIVSGGFTHVYDRLDEISTKLDVRIRVDLLEKKIQKIESALHIKL